MLNNLRKLGISIPIDNITKLFSDTLTLDNKIEASQKEKLEALKVIIRMYNAAAPVKSKKISNPKDAYTVLKDRLRNLNHEELYVILLANDSSILDMKMLTKGGLNSTVIDPKMVAIEALKNRAASVILAHNHPSGSALPSKIDIEETRKIKKSLELFNISLLDHIIICTGEYYSFADELLTKTI